MNSKTIFEKIINSEIPGYILYEDSDFALILDVSPQNSGHSLLVTKKPYKNIFEVDELTLSKISPLVKELSRRLVEALHADGVKIVQNNGKSAGQEVMHYHLHLIPMYNSQGTLPYKEDLKAIYSLIKPYFEKWN